MSDFLSRRAGAAPDKLAACMADGSAALTYQALDRAADRMAAWFQHRGLAAGDTVAMLHDNRVDVLIWWWGARRAGLYYVPLGTRLTARELAYIIRDCGARMLLATEPLTELAREAGALVEGVDVILADSVEAIDDLAPAPVALVGRELIYSSGTTGRPKGIRRALSPAERACELPPLEIRMRALFRIDVDAVYLSVAPLYHATGRFLNRVIESGGTVVIAPKFDAESALAAIERHRVTHTQWVPTMFTRLLALPDALRGLHDLSSLRVALHAAAPCPVSVKRAMIDWWGPIIDEYYGGSENAGITFIPAEEWLSHPGSVGRSITGAIHILDEEDPSRELAPGEIGLIYFEGGVPFEYIGAEPDQPSHNSASGWASYGDLGHVDADGYLYISDRRSDLIISGGVNIYPKEIELVLEAHPAVAEAAVIGVPDAEFGQSAHALVRLAEGYMSSDDLAAELLLLCRSELSRVKCPRGIDFVPEFPRSDTGKLLKRELRERFSVDAGP